METAPKLKLQKSQNFKKLTYSEPDNIGYLIDTYLEADNTEQARAQTVLELSKLFDKPVASIRGKLGALGMYKPKVRAKPGNIETKDKIADKIAKIAKENYDVIFSDGEIESLVKSNKTALRKIIKMIEIIDFENE